MKLKITYSSDEVVDLLVKDIAAKLSPKKVDLVEAEYTGLDTAVTVEVRDQDYWLDR